MSGGLLRERLVHRRRRAVGVLLAALIAGGLALLVVHNVKRTRALASAPAALPSSVSGPASASSLPVPPPSAAQRGTAPALNLANSADPAPALIRRIFTTPAGQVTGKDAWDWAATIRAMGKVALPEIEKLLASSDVPQRVLGVWLRLEIEGPTPAPVSTRARWR